MRHLCVQYFLRQQAIGDLEVRVKMRKLLHLHFGCWGLPEVVWLLVKAHVWKFEFDFVFPLISFKDYFKSKY